MSVRLTNELGRAAAPEGVGAATDVALWIDPPSHHLERDRLFDLATSPTSGDGILGPYLHLRALLVDQGISVHTADLLDVSPTERRVNLYVSTGITKRFRRLARRDDVIMSAFFALEAPIVGERMFGRLHEAARCFRRMFAVNDGRAMLPYLKAPVVFEPIRYTYPFESVDDAAWSRTDRAFLAMINANKTVPSGLEHYSQRMGVIEYFARAGELDLYGIGWDGPAYRVSDKTTWIPGPIRGLGRRAEHVWSRMRPDPQMVAARSVWKGPVASKLDTLSRYHFSICIENQLLDGWITEKILDCLRAGCIPVYLGAPDVERWIPSECFIDMRQFDEYADLSAYMHSLGERELRGYREAGREFLGSERFRPFSKRAFVDVFARILAEDAGVQI